MKQKKWIKSFNQKIAQLSKNPNPKWTPHFNERLRKAYSAKVTSQQKQLIESSGRPCEEKQLYRTHVLGSYLSSYQLSHHHLSTPRQQDLIYNISVIYTNLAPSPSKRHDQPIIDMFPAAEMWIGFWPMGCECLSCFGSWGLEHFGKVLMVGEWVEGVDPWCTVVDIKVDMMISGKWSFSSIELSMMLGPNNFRKKKTFWERLFF